MIGPYDKSSARSIRGNRAALHVAKQISDYLGDRFSVMTTDDASPLENLQDGDILITRKSDGLRWFIEVTSGSHFNDYVGFSLRKISNFRTSPTHYHVLVYCNMFDEFSWDGLFWPAKSAKNYLEKIDDPEFSLPSGSSGKRMMWKWYYGLKCLKTGKEVFESPKTFKTKS